MKDKKLVIVDIKKDERIQFNDSNYIYLNIGKIEFKNSKRIFLKKLRKNNLLEVKENLIHVLKKKVEKSRKILKFFPELEFFNLRNDKDSSIDLLVNLLIIKKFIKKKSFKKIIVITDNDFTNDFFSFYKNYKIIFLNKKKNLKYNFYSLKILKFFIKSLIVIFFAKIFSNSYKKFDEACITLSPIFFKKKREILFKKNTSLKINFLLADETQLGFSLFKILRILFKKKTSNLLNIESQISFKNLFKSYLIARNNLKSLKKINFNLYLKNYNFKEFYRNKIYKSFINRAKLEIYDGAIQKIINKYKLKKINLFLFEYSFGFYLINQIRKNQKPPEIHAYQHGIFYKDLFWLDVISNINNFNNYSPDYIYAFNKKIIKDYKKFFKNKKINFTSRSKDVSEISKKIKYKKTLENKVLVLPGTHDALDIVENLNYIQKKNNRKNYKYFIKFHPKRKIQLSNENKILVLNKLEKIHFNKVAISPTSTIVYDMLKLKKPFYIFDIDYKLNYVPKIPQF